MGRFRNLDYLEHVARLYLAQRCRDITTLLSVDSSKEIDELNKEEQDRMEENDRALKRFLTYIFCLYLEKLDRSWESLRWFRWCCETLMNLCRM